MLVTQPNSFLGRVLVITGCMTAGPLKTTDRLSNSPRLAGYLKLLKLFKIGTRIVNFPPKKVQHTMLVSSKEIRDEKYKTRSSSVVWSVRPGNPVMDRIFRRDMS